jgi:hypothetical protein
MTDPKRYFRDIENYDMCPKQGSPAIDAGSAALAPRIDINGIPRPRGAGIGIRPYEFKNIPVKASK